MNVGHGSNREYWIPKSYHYNKFCGWECSDRTSGGNCWNLVHGKFTCSSPLHKKVDKVSFTLDKPPPPPQDYLSSAQFPTNQICLKMPINGRTECPVSGQPDAVCQCVARENGTNPPPDNQPSIEDYIGRVCETNSDCRFSALWCLNTNRCDYFPESCIFSKICPKDYECGVLSNGTIEPCGIGNNITNCQCLRPSGPQY